MNKIILYHGSPNQLVNPVFGGGDDKHDHGHKTISNIKCCIQSICNESI